MSPGRCALPSGMFSTRPSTPTTLALALRAAIAYMAPVTAAAPAMSPFMSSIEAAGLIEMPPESKTTPLPTKAIGAAPSAPPLQRSTTSRIARLGPLPDAEQRPHPEFGHRLLVEDLDLDAELHQLRRAAGEFRRSQDVRRLIDESPCEHDGVRQMAAIRHRGAMAVGIGQGDDDLHRPFALGLVLLLRLVMVEFVGAQPAAERELADRVVSGGNSFRQVEQHDRPRPRADFRRGLSAKRQEVLEGLGGFAALSPGLVPGADADQNHSARGRAGRRQNLERRSRLALEFRRCGGARKMRGRILEHARRRARPWRDRGPRKRRACADARRPRAGAAALRRRRMAGVHIWR